MSRFVLWLQFVAMMATLLSAPAATMGAALPFDRTSPVIYDNDGAVESGYTDVYVMALASAGVINLRGIITTGTYGEQPPFVPRSEEYLLLERSELVAKARRSGLRNIPDPSPGPGVSLSSRRPASGVIEHTPPVGARGSWLIVNEARQATPARPLVVIMGGQGSALADAYLLDNSIADKVVAVWLVGGKRSSNGVLHGFEYNAYTDVWATHIIFERLRAVVFPVEDEGDVAYTPKSWFAQLPDSEIRQHILENRWPRVANYSEPSHNWDGLGAIAMTRPGIVISTQQIAFDHWEADIWGGPYPIPAWRADPNGRVTMVTRVDAALATQEWWLQMLNPAIWGTPVGAVPFSGNPALLPGTIEAEHFDHGGNNLAYFDNTNNWTTEAWFNPFRFLEHVDIRSSNSASGSYFVTSNQAGEWLRYTLTAASAGTYTLEVGVASVGSGGSFHVEFNGVDKTGPMTVPNTGGAWTVLTKTGLILSAGPQVMRLVMDSNGASGQVGDFDWLRLSSVTAPPPAAVSISVAVSDANAAEAGLDPGVFTITRSGDTSGTLAVYYSVSGSATNGADYNTISDGPLTFQPGQNTATLIIMPIDDSLAEGPETVVLTLVGHSAYAIGAQASAALTIADNDVATPYALTASPSSVSAGGGLTISWRVAGVPTAVRDWIGLYVVGSPNTAFDPSRWFYTNGATSGTITIAAPGAPGTYEFRYLLNDHFNSIASSAAVTVSGAPVPVVGIVATANAAEPATHGSFTVSRTGSTSNALTVNFAASGTAAMGSDYTNIGASVVIPANASSVTIPVNVIDDGLHEGVETVIVTVSNSPNYNVSDSSSATVTIADNEAAMGGPSLAAAPGAVAPNETITTTWSGLVTATARDWIALSVVGSNSGSYLAWAYVSCTTAATVAGASGSCQLGVPANAANGSYELRLFANDGFNLIARSAPIAIGGPSGPAVSVDRTAANRGSSVTVTWSGIASPTGRDWVGFYPMGAGASAYRSWVYVNCGTSPTTARAVGSCPLHIPANTPAGSYEVRLLVNDGFNIIATSSPLTVQ